MATLARCSRALRPARRRICVRTHQPIGSSRGLHHLTERLLPRQQSGLHRRPGRKSHRACIGLHRPLRAAFDGRFWVHPSLHLSASTDAEQPLTGSQRHVRFFLTDCTSRLGRRFTVHCARALLQMIGPATVPFGYGLRQACCLLWSALELEFLGNVISRVRYTPRAYSHYPRIWHPCALCSPRASNAFSRRTTARRSRFTSDRCHFDRERGCWGS